MNKLVIADAGPLIAFARLHLIGLLPQIFGRVLVTDIVFADCAGDRHGGCAGAGETQGLGSAGEALVGKPCDFRLFSGRGNNYRSIVSIRRVKIDVHARLCRSVAGCGNCPTGCWTIALCAFADSDSLLR